MNTIIKKLLIAFILTAAVSGLYAENTSPEVDLSITITSLGKAAVSGKAVPASGTAVILNGTVIERRVISADPENFEGELVLASGEWINSDSVVVSKCIVRLTGQKFAEAIPARRSRGQNPKEIGMNSELLVYGLFLGYTETPEGPAAVIEAAGTRKL